MSMVLSPDKKALDARKAAGIARRTRSTMRELAAADAEPDDLTDSDVTSQS